MPSTYAPNDHGTANKSPTVFVVGDGLVLNGKHGGGALPDDDPVHSQVKLLDGQKTNKNDSSSEEEEEMELSTCGKVKSWMTLFMRLILLLTMLYFFICSLTLLSDGFTLVGGRVAGTAFQNNELLQNPICGLMIGVVCTAFLQSSSTSTSIIITMVASGLFSVQMSIPIIMGANIGTSVTGILVAVTQSGDVETFRRAFSGATVHDMFNWLTVISLLPLEIATGYLFYLTSAIVDATEMAGDGQQTEFLSLLTKPFTSLIVQVDKEVMGLIASGDPTAADRPMLKYWCEYVTINASAINETEGELIPWSVYSVADVSTGNMTQGPTPVPTVKMGIEECAYIFHGTALNESVVGVIVLLISLVLLITCLIIMVAILKKLLAGPMASVIQRTINADFPGKAAPLTGYFAMLVGALVTILVQSSSVVTSALTPLVGLGVVTVERVFPMMLGANIGTTSTAILAAFAASGDKVTASFQIALCHLFFNLTGILIWYPIPFMRQVPIGIARFLGKTTSRYRWFAGLYLLLMFFLLPLSVFALSIAGWEALVAVGVPLILLLITIGIINVLQNKKSEWLPEWLRTWEFLPEPLRSLAPMDRMLMRCCKCCSCKSQGGSDSSLSGKEGIEDTDEEMKEIPLTAVVVSSEPVESQKNNSC